MSAKQNIFEQMVDDLAENLVDTVQGFPEAEVPFAAVKLSPNDQLRRYYTVRDDPAQWWGLIQKHGLKAVVRYAQHMGKQAEEGENAPV